MKCNQVKLLEMGEKFVLKLVLKLLQAKFLPNNISYLSSYLTGNRLRLCYKGQQLDAVQGEKSLFTVRAI
jgi:hypothetical protein